MKRSIQTITLLITVLGLSACNNGGASSSSTPTSAPESSSVPATSSSKDPYENRIKSLDFTVVDLTKYHYRSEDPKYPDITEAKAIEEYYLKDKIKLYYLDELNDVYYAPISTFASLITPDLADGYTSSIEEKGTTSSWTIKKGEDISFRLSFDPKEKIMYLDGELDNEFLKNEVEGRTGVNDNAILINEYVEGHKNTTSAYHFGDYDFDFFEIDGKYCYPFGLIHLGLTLNVERNFIFNTNKKELIEYGPTEQLAEATILRSKDSEDTINVTEYIQDCYVAQYADKTLNQTIQPQALTDFNNKLFLFIMDNFYGMADQKGILSMSDYIANFKDAEDMLSSDGGARFAAYYRSLQMLNDLHSQYSPSQYFTEMPNWHYKYEQTFWKDRFDLNAYLKAERTNEIKNYNEIYGTNVGVKDMRYSGDGKYGYFSFDSFSTFHHFGDDPVPEEVLLEDTFHLFLRNLNEAKAKGVKRIIIDDSVNGGGEVAIMGKLLALMSKNGQSEMFLRCDNNEAILKMTTKLDLNEDGVTDEKDCFGNDFEFYIATSNFSYSCGNAFPFYAHHNKYATIIGQQSGGGECCVFEYCFTSGQSMRYSSPYHVGYIDKDGKYVGDEIGGETTFSLIGEFYNIYDVDYLESYLDIHDPIEA